MTETITPDKELRVGDGWRYQCWRCDYKVGIDERIPEKCPGCRAGGWWGHLVTPIIPQNNAKEGRGDSKNSNDKMSGGINTPKRILSQQNNAVVYAEGINEGVYEPSQGRGRGRPLQKVPEDLIKKLDIEGFSSRAMADELDRRGFKNIGYKVVQRRLHRARMLRKNE